MNDRGARAWSYATVAIVVMVVSQGCLAYVERRDAAKIADLQAQLKAERETDDRKHGLSYADRETTKSDLGAVGGHVRTNSDRLDALEARVAGLVGAKE